MSKKKINKNKRKDKINLFDGGGNLFSSLPENLTMPTMAGLPMSPSFGKMDLQNMKLNPINTMMKNPFQDKLGAAVGKFGTGVASAVDILGSSLDNAKIADTSAQEASIDSQKNMVVGASSNDELMAEWGNFNKVKDDYTKRDVRGGNTGQKLSNTLSSTGQGVMGGMTVGGPIGGIVGGVVGLGSAIGGWLGGNRKARKKARKLNKIAKEANERALSTLENKAEDIDTQNDFNMLANFSALGGPLNLFAKGGKIDNMKRNKDEYTKYSKYRKGDEAAAKRSAKLNSRFKYNEEVPDLFWMMRGLTPPRQGAGYSGGKGGGGGAGGKFTASDPLGIQRHFVNPIIAVEEDFNTAFSRARKAGKSEFDFGGKRYNTEIGDNPKNYEAGKKRVEASFLPTDEYLLNSVSKANPTRNDTITRPVPLAEYVSMKQSDAANRKKYGDGNTFAEGGILENPSNTNGGVFSNGITRVEAGGTHEENPNMGIQLGVDQEGTPNLVEQGEILFKDYVFSDRIKLPKDLKKEHKFRGKTFADAAKNAQRESEERPFDPISKRGLEDSMGRLMMAQEGIKEEQSQKEDNPNVFAKGGMKQTFTRFAPLVGSASGALSNIFSKPDYSEADRVQNVDVKPAMVGWSPIGNYMSYNPLDRDFYINKMNQQTAATRDNIRNTAGGNRAVAQAGLLASDYNYGQNLGNMARQAEEYNQAQRERVEGFNRQTNMYNTETGLKAGMFNAESMNNSKRLQLSKAGSVAQMRQAIKDNKNASLSANMSSMFQGLGDIGWENEQSNWLNMLARNGVLKMDTNGNYIGDAISPLSRAHNQRKGK